MDNSDYPRPVTVVDQTMPALFSQPASTSDDALVPVAQLGVGPDGTALLARRGSAIVELLQLDPSRFSSDGPRWAALEARVRAIGSIQSPAVRAVLALEPAPPSVILEGDSAPPLAELLEQQALDLPRALKLITELARAIAAAHHVGIEHGRLDPWAVHVGAGDRIHVELTGLDTKPMHHAWVDRCRAPELALDAVDQTTDVYALGALLDLAAGTKATPRLRELIAGAMNEAPELRPRAIELVQRLAYVDQPAGLGPVTLDDDVQTPVRPARPSVGLRVGRYELIRQLGVGAMGEVWSARDLAGGEDVAIKLLKPEIAADAELLRRFRKEARVLGRVGSPYIANFIDLNDDRGLHYLVLELVVGGSVGAALKKMTRLPERLALGIIGDTCRALAEPHRLGIVHRDIKPDNMMFMRAGLELESAPVGQLVKLGDFGIARLSEGAGASEGATREGSVLGTPEYMAPEQCQGTNITPATDVYAIGCCLFMLIAGRTPFQAIDDNQMTVILQHLKDPPPRLETLVPEVSPQVADLIARCLAKDPRTRPADATEVLAVIEQMCDGVAALITAHPAPPIFRSARIQTYRFAWELAASPEALWPFVSNTEKMNRATGLAPVKFAIEAVRTNPPGSSTMTGSQRVAGMKMSWKEMPYEWIEGSRHVVLRVFDRGLLRWYSAEVTLERTAGGGTKLTNTVKLEPRGLIARVLSKWEIGVKYRRNLDRVYRRLDKLITNAGGGDLEVDPIDPEITIGAIGRQRVQRLVGELASAGIETGAREGLASFLLSASDQDVARIRPLELGARLGVDDEALVDACLHAAKAGALGMVWDVICPSCRIPSNVVDSLQKIEAHDRCRACNISYEVDFSRAIELAFRAAPDIREVETRTYCVGGPAHFPHVTAQIRLAPGERFALPLAVGPGFYQVRSPQLAREYDFRVVAQGGVRRADLILGEPTELPPLTAGDQLLTLVNPDPKREMLVRVERSGERRFALTAARVMANSTFRDLFPDQQLAPGRLMAVTQTTLLVAVLDDAPALFQSLGDHKAFPVASRFFELVGQLAKEYGGSLIKTFGGLAIAAFERPGPAVDAALGLQAAIDRHPVTTGLRCQVAVHRGPVMALTQGGKLDYFGQNVELALALAHDTPPGIVGLSASVSQEPQVAERLNSTPDQLGLVPFGSSWVLQIRAGRSTARALPPASETAGTLVA